MGDTKEKDTKQIPEITADMNTLKTTGILLQDETEYTIYVTVSDSDSK